MVVDGGGYRCVRDVWGVHVLWLVGLSGKGRDEGLLAKPWRCAKWPSTSIVGGCRAESVRPTADRLFVDLALPGDVREAVRRPMAGCQRSPTGRGEGNRLGYFRSCLKGVRLAGRT